MMVQRPLTYFVMEHKGVAIGCAGISTPPEIGIILHPEHWRTGFVTEAMNAIIAHIFTTIDLLALTTDIDPRNAASTATLQKLGFVQTHSAKRTYFIGVVSSDSDYYALQRP